MVLGAPGSRLLGREIDAFLGGSSPQREESLVLTGNMEASKISLGKRSPFLLSRRSVLATDFQTSAPSIDLLMSQAPLSLDFLGAPNGIET